MEDASSSSMSDRDRKMSENFEVFDDSDDKKEKKKKKADKKTPKRSLFLPSADKAEQTHKAPEKSTADAWIERQKERAQRKEGILSSIMKEDGEGVKSSSSSESDTSVEEKAEDAREVSVSSEDDGTESTIEVSTADWESEQKDLEAVVDQFEQKVAEKIDTVELEIAGSQTAELATELSADAEFLQDVKEYVADGTEPEQAIETALDETIEEMVDDAINNEELAQETTELVEGVEYAELEVSAEDAEHDSTTPLATTPRTPAKPVTPTALTPVARPTVSSPSTPSVAAVTPKSISRPSRPRPMPLKAPAPPVSPPLPTAPRRFGSPPGGGSGGGLPPSPNVSMPNFNSTPASPNIVAANTANVDPNLSKMNDFYYRRKNTGKVILAGLVGYAVGRRGGRKRTEARLQPEVDHGQKAVKQLEKKLEQSEHVVRKKASENQSLREKLSERQVDPAQKEAVAGVAPIEAKPQPAITSEQLPPAALERPAEQVSSAESTPQAIVENSQRAEAPKAQSLPAETIAQEVREIQKQREQYFDRFVVEEASVMAPSGGEVTAGSAPENVENIKQRTEANQKPTEATTEMSSPVVGPERYERTVLQSPDARIETVPAQPAAASREVYSPPTASELNVPSEKRKKSTVEESPSKAPEKHVDTRSMTMPEVLEMAEKIDAGAGSVKDLYEQGRIDGVNLRKVVAEHAAGRNFEATLDRSLDAEEMKHELRNEVKTDSTGLAPGTKGSGFSSGFGGTGDMTGGGATGRGSGAPASISAGALPDGRHKALPEHALPNMVQTGLSVPTVSQVPPPQQPVQTEYVKVSTPVAIALGIGTGGAIAGLLMLFIF